MQLGQLVWQLWLFVKWIESTQNRNHEPLKLWLYGCYRNVNRGIVVVHVYNRDCDCVLSRLSVCLSLRLLFCSCSNYWKPWLRTLFLVSRYVIRILMLSLYIKVIGTIINVPKYTHSRVALVPLKGNLELILLLSNSRNASWKPWNYLVAILPIDFNRQWNMSCTPLRKKQLKGFR